jgi:hypothetical protein
VLYPYLHCLVTRGGLTVEGQWRAEKNGFLLPVRVVMSVFRGKLRDTLDRAVRQGQLTWSAGMRLRQWDTLRKKLGRKKWNVHICERYPHGAGVLTYVARSIHGGPMANQRVVECTHGEVTFRYRSNGEAAASQRSGLITLFTEEFLHRSLFHVPAPGARVVRSYGLYAPTKRTELALCRAQVGQTPRSII